MDVLNFIFVLSVLLVYNLKYILACPCKNVSLCIPIKNVPSNEIFVFLGTVERTQWSMLDWTKITTIAISENYKYLHEFMCYAHERNVRLVPEVDFGPKQDLTDPDKRKAWINKYSDFIVQNYLDGINIDFEKSIASTDKAIVDGYTSLVRETKIDLRKSNPYAQISIDVECTPLDPNRGYDYKALGQICDFFFVMDYDEGFTQPISANAGFYNSKIGLLVYMVHGIPANKLVMGLPWYGLGTKCKVVVKNYCYHAFGIQEEGYSVRRHSLRPVVAEFEKGSHGDQTSYCYRDILPLLKSHSVYGRQWNNESLTPFFYFKDNSSQIYQMQYDDPESLSLKSSLAVEMKLRGVGVFITDCLDFSDTPEARDQRRQLWSSLPTY